jgi:hypothetical protein
MKVEDIQNPSQLFEWVEQHAGSQEACDSLYTVLSKGKMVNGREFYYSDTTLKVAPGYLLRRDLVKETVYMVIFTLRCENGEVFDMNFAIDVDADGKLGKTRWVPDDIPQLPSEPLQ